MVFSSSVFLFAFLPAFLLLYWLSPRFLRTATLALASFVFYGWWKAEFVLLLLFSSVVDYWIGGRIVRARREDRDARRWLALSVVVNLGLLAWFKYANFGVETFRALLHGLGFAGDFVWVDVVLPVGISFYTFQTMSYTIDLYRGEVQPAARFVDFLCYVSMFPQLVAGPIVRYSLVEDELRNRRSTREGIYHGVLFFQIGLAKKVLLADAVARFADAAFDVPGADGLTLGLSWLGAVAYAFQIYFDFSGYSDMAIGLGLMLGFHFPINFDAPYRADSITDFWRRWHISLSTWLRDYLYVPLGGNRRGARRTYVNLMLTMLLGGLWHGAAWNFLAWGGYQGFWLAVERAAARRPFYGMLPHVLRIAFTFVLVLFGWVLFRANDLGHAIRYASAMVGLGGGDEPAHIALHPGPWGEMAVCALIVWLLPTSQRIVPRAHPAFVLVLQLLFVFAVLVVRLAPEEIPFLYFRF
ncbi:MAG: MBOAT family protein [Planctomycetes bacterium]|nr:MBOAT family protein [Planctomycetota bacterium]